MKKNLIYLIIFSFILFLLPSPSLAIVGQLIYNTGAPEQANASPYIEALNTCKAESEKNNTLYKKCTQQQSQQNKAYEMLAKSLTEEKKKTTALEIGLGVALLFSIIMSILFFLKKSTISSTQDNQIQKGEL